MALVVGISPLATDMYIPGLPQLAGDLRTTPQAAQLTLTAFLLSFALGQLLIGPLSDAVGRRRLLIIGTATFTLASLGCGFANSIELLIAARLIQGVAGACGAVVGRAMVTDVLTGSARARAIGSLSAINAVGPVAAPLIGGVLISLASWRLPFAALAAVGLVLSIWAVLRFPETLPPHRRSPGIGLAASLRRMGTLLKIPRFSLYLATSCLATVGFFSYIATSSFVFQGFYGYSDRRYSVVFASNACLMIITTLVFRRLVGRVSEDRLLSVGLIVASLASAATLLIALTDGPAPAIWACLAVVVAAQGFIITGSASRTQALGQSIPGTAAALQGGLAFGFGGLGSPLAALFGGTPTAMAVVMLIGLGTAALLQLVGPQLIPSAPVDD